MVETIWLSDALWRHDYMTFNGHDEICRKIIGAGFYSWGFEAANGSLESINSISFRSARDSDGHGTHTASTIAGAVVENVSLFGMARGTARGGAPSARLAIYKACWFNLCYDADILSALDDAINDVVDILSLSFGPSPPQPIYFEDSTSIWNFPWIPERNSCFRFGWKLHFPWNCNQCCSWDTHCCCKFCGQEILLKHLSWQFKDFEGKYFRLCPHYLPYLSNNEKHNNFCTAGLFFKSSGN